MSGVSGVGSDYPTQISYEGTGYFEVQTNMDRASLYEKLNQIALESQVDTVDKSVTELEAGTDANTKGVSSGGTLYPNGGVDEITEQKSFQDSQLDAFQQIGHNIELMLMMQNRLGG